MVDKYYNNKQKGAANSVAVSTDTQAQSLKQWTSQYFFRAHPSIATHFRKYLHSICSRGCLLAVKAGTPEINEKISPN